MALAPRKLSRLKLERRFNEDRANRLCAFFDVFVKIVEGDKNVGEPMHLLPHWEEFGRELVGWEMEDGRLWYRHANVCIPRKNAKTSTLAGIGLALPPVVFEKVAHGQGYILGNTEEQSMIAFNMMRRYIEASPDLSEIYYHCTDYIEYSATGFRIMPLTNAIFGKTGFKPDFVILDEYQERRNYNLESKLTTGNITSMSTLMIRIFTCGTQADGPETPWVKLLEEMRESKENPNPNSRVLNILYEPPPDADPNDPEVWAMANPGLGYNIDFETFAANWEDVKNDNARRNDFMQYNLNMIVPAGSELWDMNRWDQLKSVYTWEDLIKKVCYGGLDVGKSDDMTAFYLLFPEWHKETVLNDDLIEETVMVPRIKQLVWYFSTEDRVKQSGKARANWQPWVNDKYIEIVGKESIVPSKVAKRIIEICRHFKVMEIGYDPAYASEIVKILLSKNMKMVVVKQEARVLNDPIERVKDMVRSGDIEHNGNPVFDWNLRNTKVVMSNRKLQMIEKPTDQALKIDGMAAGLNAMRVFMDAPPPKPPREIRII